MDQTDKTWAERISDKGLTADMREYQQLKEAKEMEIEGTRRLYEKYKREGGEVYAIEKLKRMGYNPKLIGR